MNFWLTLPEIRCQSCLLGWAFGPRKLMKNCHADFIATHERPPGLTRLAWISGAFCRKFAASPVCPRVRSPPRRWFFEPFPGFGAHSPRWFFVPGLPKDGLPGPRQRNPVCALDII